MKVIMEFDFDKEDSSDREEYETYKQAPEMSSALWEMSQYLRGLDKYGHSFKSTEEAIEQIRQQFHDFCINLGENTI